jgi:hypothetical protein
LSGAVAADKARLAFRFALAAVALIITIGSVFVFFTPRPEPGVERQAAVQPQEADTMTDAPQPKKDVQPRGVRRSRPRRQTRLLISQWRSPTDFLLKTSGEQLLKAVPRLNDSIVQFRVMPDERN